MRFLAIAVVLLSGPTVSRGIGEFEKQIEAATAIEDKVALAEEGFRAIEGFVPRELFMSYWSIDSLGEIASFYQSILESKGIAGLVSDYSNISRICRMEMGDHRYFFEPIKAELDTLLEQCLESNESSKDPLKGWDILMTDSPSLRTVESVHSLIEFWFLSGYVTGASDIDDLLKADWSDSDIEYWDLVFSKFHLSPNRVISAMRDKLLIGHTDSDALVEALGLETPLWLVPEIGKGTSEVSSGGPRQDEKSQ